MSKLTFISNADAHIAAGAITTVATGVSGIWDVNGNAFQGAAALLATDVVEVVQGNGAGAYPVFSQLFEMRGVKQIYTPWIAPVLGTQTVLIAAVGGAGTIHSFKIVRRASDIGYSNMINGTTDFGRTDQVTPIEYVEVAGDTTASIALALAVQANSLGKSYGFLADATTVASSVTIYANQWGGEYEVVNSLPVANTVTAVAKVEGNGNYWQVLSAEKETQAMAGYHSRAGSFLNTPATHTSTALAANPAIVADAQPTAPTTGYDCLTLVVPCSTSGNAAGDASATSLISIYFDDTAGAQVNLIAQFGFVNGTASTITL